VLRDKLNIELRSLLWSYPDRYLEAEVQAGGLPSDCGNELIGVLEAARRWSRICARPALGIDSCRRYSCALMR